MELNGIYAVIKSQTFVNNLNYLYWHSLEIEADHKGCKARSIIFICFSNNVLSLGSGLGGMLEFNRLSVLGKRKFIWLGCLLGLILVWLGGLVGWILWIHDQFSADLVCPRL